MIISSTDISGRTTSCENPLPAGSPSFAVTEGLRRSNSINKTFLSNKASDTAKFNATYDFPSPDIEEVKRIRLPPFKANSRLVRIARNCSAIGEREVLLTTTCSLSSECAIAPNIGNLFLLLISSTDCTRTLSKSLRYIRQKGKPKPSTIPTTYIIFRFGENG